MVKAALIGAGIVAAACAGAGPARAQWFVRPYPFYVPAPVYRPYYPPPPAYYPPAYAPAYPPAYAPAPPRPSAAIMELQRTLADLGYDPGPADGFAGPRLAEAVQAFQRDHGGPVNGRLTGETIGAIREAARSRDSVPVPAPSANAVPTNNDQPPPPPPPSERSTLSVRPPATQ